jgi:carboxymethylenebutenolidase
VNEEAIEIQTLDGTVDGFLYRAAEGASAPGVLQLTDIGGIRASNRESAKRLAAAGYTVLLPNVFYRTAKPPVFDRAAPGDVQKQRMAELTGPLTPDAVELDASAYVGFLNQSAGARPGPMGVVGYCFSGGVALRIAAAQPETIAAAASFHGGGLYTDSPTSPHRVLSRVRAQLYFGHAFGDRSMPAEAIAKLEAALAAWGGAFESETYEGASHGWTTTDSPVYHEAQAERAFGKLLELFAALLR